MQQVARAAGGDVCVRVTLRGGPARRPLAYGGACGRGGAAWVQDGRARKAACDRAQSACNALRRLRVPCGSWPKTKPTWPCRGPAASSAHSAPGRRRKGGSPWRMRLARLLRTRWRGGAAPCAAHQRSGTALTCAASRRRGGRARRLRSAATPSGAERRPLCPVWERRQARFNPPSTSAASPVNAASRSNFVICECSLRFSALAEAQLY